MAQKLPRHLERLMAMAPRERCLHTFQVLAAENDWEAAREDALDFLWRYLGDSELEAAFNAVGTGRRKATARKEIVE